MQNFIHFLAKNPKDIRMVFIADLHLSDSTPAINQAFLAFIKQLSTLPKLESLYILGDWLDAWIGDDDYLTLSDDEKSGHWLTPILQSLKKISNKIKIHIMHGNRDFTIRQELCHIIDAQLIKEPYYLNSQTDQNNHKLYRLEHGDRLCTDDKHYQYYRKAIRNPMVSWLLLKQPLASRRQLAQKIKNKSKKSKIQKPIDIMDVNTKVAEKTLKNCDVIIHGHTHRPAVHHHIHGKKRLVLGDWRYHDNKVQAVIGVMSDSSNEVGLYEFIHHI